MATKNLLNIAAELSVGLEKLKREMRIPTPDEKEKYEVFEILLALRDELNSTVDNFIEGEFK